MKPDPMGDAENRDRHSLLERDRLVERYVLALDSGDLEAAAAVMLAAQDDPDLDRILAEIHHDSAREDELLTTGIDRKLVRTLLRTGRAVPAPGRDPELSASRRPAALFPWPLSLRPIIAGLCLLICAGLAVRFAFLEGHRRFAGPPPELSPLETQVMGQRTWLRGGPAALRVIVTDHGTGLPVNASVRIVLERLDNGKPTGQPYPLFDGRTNQLGTLDASFTAPAAEPGPYQLVVNVSSELGDDSIVQPIELQESVQCLLTSDKPVYQPGQTIHLRALALDMATRNAFAGRPVTFEVEDGRGNKVFKQKGTLSKFGIASADFVLADEVNMGTFTLRAVLPTGQAEKKVRVDRYVLPKFKVSLTPERPYYLPGEKIEGTLQASYFFGKPVAHAHVTLEVSTADIGVSHLADLHGETSADGGYEFEYSLPNSLIGLPMEGGKAVVELHATVKDTADQQEEARATVPVSQDPLLIAIVPECSVPVAGVSNHVTIAVASPDGTPVKNARVRVTYSGASETPQASPASATTDELGLCSAGYVSSGKADARTIHVWVEDSDGRTSEKTQDLGRPVDAGLILRPDRTLARVGESLSFLVLTPARQGTIYLDVIRNQQTILTRAEPIRPGMGAGQADMNLPVTNDMVGTLEVHAYEILPDEEIVRDVRRIVVQPAHDLDVRVSVDRDQYRPGDEARIQMEVKDENGRPSPAALGAAIVDESVFALSELQPGLEKIYFTLEKELLEPKYEIHGLTPKSLLDPAESLGRPVSDQARQRAAAMLLAAVPPKVDFDFKVDTYKQRFEEFRKEIVAEMDLAMQRIQAAVERYQQSSGRQLRAEQSLYVLVEKGYLRDTDLKDHWGHYYRTDLHGSPYYRNYSWDFPTLISAGPDGVWDTGDDIQRLPAEMVMARGGWGGGFDNNDGPDRFGGPGGVRHAVPRLRVLNGLASWGSNEDGELGSGSTDSSAVPAAAGAKAAAAAPMAAPGAIQMDVAAKMASIPPARPTTSPAAARVPSEPASAPAPRIRQYFPETMYWNPAILTDDRGHAELRVPLADSITTWRLSLLASTLHGGLGSATAAIKVFQDFFVDIDLPVVLTQNDFVQIPVAVYNYLPIAQDVRLTLDQGDWFTLSGPAVQAAHLLAGEVKVVYYPITTRAIGKHTLTVTAAGSSLSDAIRRPVEVVPNGKEFRTTVNDRLDSSVEKMISFPSGAIPGASNLWVKLYPGAFSQVVEGLDGLLQMPSGCFEQTSSITYPDVLVLDYLKTNKRVNPEMQMKAEQYINVGYQRLLTFECKSGGFSWFGDEPAHQILTAYGLLEFSDMAKVHEVDPEVIRRTQEWLAGRQLEDGSWLETNQGIAEGIINRQNDKLRTTAYVAWALSESGYSGPALVRGLSYVEAHRQDARDPYTLAVILNLLDSADRDGSATSEVSSALISMAHSDGKSAYWSGINQTFTGAGGSSADLETTGLAAYALARSGRDGGFVNRVLTRLVQSKNSYGAWDSTQGTVWSMKALLWASRNSVGGGGGTVTVYANGRKAQEYTIAPDDSDVMRQVDLGAFLRDGANSVRLEYRGDGSLLYQVVSRYYLPWKMVAQQEPTGPLSIKVAYDKTRLSQDTTATVTVTIHNNTHLVAGMPLIDLGIPPGFTVLPEALDRAVQEKRISKYTQAARQILVYLEKLDGEQTVTLTYRLLAKYPIRVRTPLSRVYPYYNPEKQTVVAPVDVVVM